MVRRTARMQRHAAVTQPTKTRVRARRAMQASHLLFLAISEWERVGVIAAMRAGAAAFVRISQVGQGRPQQHGWLACGSESGGLAYSSAWVGLACGSGHAHR